MQTGMELPRRCGATTAQMKAADTRAMYIVHGSVLAYKALADSLSRPDLVIEGDRVLTLGGQYKFAGMPIGKQVIVDHGVPIDAEKQSVLYRLSQRLKITMWNDLPEGIRKNVEARHKANLASAPVKSFQKKQTLGKISADVKSWDPINGTALTIRDAQGKQIARLKFFGVQADDPGQLRDRSMILAEQIAELINGPASSTAEVLPKHIPEINIKLPPESEAELEATQT